MAAENDLDQLPLQGVVLCCTSLGQDVRVELADMATQMGAINKLDLTSDVTHLLVGCITTPKYRYVAKERPDIKVLEPEFIRRVRDAWIEGGEVNVEMFEEHFRMKTFAGLEMCLTGFSDVAQRRDMERTCKEQGARWSADLTKQVTHLIAAAPEGAKYTHAKQWGITVVGLKWYEDSLVRGMAVDEALYACEIPREEQGVGAFRTMPQRTSLGKRGRESSVATAMPAETGRKKLRKSASRILGEQSQNLWQSMSQHEVQVDDTVVNAWNENNEETQTMRDSLGPNSAVPADVLHPGAKEAPQGLFSGHLVLIHGFDSVKTERLRSVVVANGAHVVRNVQELEIAPEHQHFKAQCLLMPHAQPIELPAVPPGTTLVTEWWVERCLHFKQELDPDQDSLSQPLQDRLVKDFEGLVISSTGFNSVDLRMSAEAIKLMGATYEEQLTSATSVLICASDTLRKEKAFYATKHGIPVVRPDWLWESLKTKCKALMDPYRIDLSQDNVRQFSQPKDSSGTGDGATVDRARQYAKSTMNSQRLSNSRNRQPTPSLKLKSAGSSGIGMSSKLITKKGPFECDDSDDADNAGQEVQDNPPCFQPTRVSHPLQEIPNNVAQNLYRDSGALTASKADHEITTKPYSPRNSPVKEVQRLTSDLAALVRNRKDSAGEAAPLGPQKRKHRPLGRNLSGTSLSNVANRSSSASPAIFEERCEADGFAPLEKPVSAPPGTQLGYDSPDAEAARIQMNKKMGVAVEEGTGIRLASMGTVKDGEELSRLHALGGRTKVRARTKT